MSNGYGGYPMPDFESMVPPVPKMYGQQQEEEYKKLKQREGFWPSLMGQMAKNLTMLANPQMAGMLEQQDQEAEQQKRDLEIMQYEQQKQTAERQATLQQMKQQWQMGIMKQQREDFNRRLGVYSREQQLKPEEQWQGVPYAEPEGGGVIPTFEEEQAARAQGMPSPLAGAFEPEAPRQGSQSALAMLRGIEDPEQREQFLSDVAAMSKAKKGPGGGRRPRMTPAELREASKARALGGLDALSESAKDIVKAYDKLIEKYSYLGDDAVDYVIGIMADSSGQPEAVIKAKIREEKSKKYK